MCSVDGTGYRLTVPGQNRKANTIQRAWLMSHFVKHVVLEPELALHEILDISPETVNRLHKTLDNELACPLVHDQDIRDVRKVTVCSECGSADDCYRASLPHQESYRAYLADVVRHDRSNPRHVYFHSQTDRNMLAFVDGAGVIVITRRKSSRLELKSGYRPCADAAYDTVMMERMKQLFPHRYFLKQARECIRRRVDTGYYYDAQFVLTENW
jgi:hypothetical protein